MSGLIIRQLPVANGTAFSKTSKKRTTLQGIPQFSNQFFPEVFFQFLPEFLEFLVERFTFRKFNSFQNFRKIFREISEPFAAVSKF